MKALILRLLTGAQIAFISDRTGLPQLYIMNSDGSSVQQMTDGGYASSPSWSPNGQFLAFAWDRKYGPGAPGGQDIYVMEVATRKWTQLTPDGGRCDFPSWSRQPHARLDHAHRRHPAPSPHRPRRRYAQLELEIMRPISHNLSAAKNFPDANLDFQ